MKHPGLPRSRFAVRYVLLVALPACQAPLYHSSDPHVFRCEKDGLCVLTDKIGSRSLVGGFRRGNEEMKFEVLHRPTTNPELPEWCKRLQDTLGQRIYTNDAPGCPIGWADGSFDGEAHSDIQPPSDRAAMMKKMLQELKFGRAPAGREHAWNLITDIVEDIYENRNSILEEKNRRNMYPDVPSSATGDYRAIGDPDYDGHTPPTIPYPAKKKVSKFCDLLRRVNGGFHPG